MAPKQKNNIKKQQYIVQNIKESQTLDKKHKEIIKNFQEKRNKEGELIDEINQINIDMVEIDKKRDYFNNDNINQRADLLNRKIELENDVKNINNCFDEMDYYDKTGDLIIEYYQLRDNTSEVKETKNILEFLGKKKQDQPTNTNSNSSSNKAEIFNKYWQRIEGIRINIDDGSKRIKYCNECNFEKIFDFTESAYICQYCGDVEEVILDEDRQIKDYSPYKRINHFREWLNQFQAKQSPDIPEEVFKDIINELNKNRITDLAVLNRTKMKAMLKKLNYNSYYEHVHYIINKLSNLPPPKITRDMERIFIKMFNKIEALWQQFKPPERKNFLSYPYVLYKFCELLELDHLLQCFQLHKAHDKLMENDEIWCRICEVLNWEFISSFK